MTTPIPEAAVEAAREALSEHLTSDIQIDYCCADIALTAARPLMEAEAKAEAWDEGADWHHRATPVERIRRLTVGQGNPYRAATIAERTQR